MTKHDLSSFPYVCINCGERVKELHKNYSNTVKAINCDKCHKVADKYIEFEPVIIIVDAMLLSQQVYRHALYNRDFKLFWKLSLMLLLLESLTLWREKNQQHIEGKLLPNLLTHENGFYFCCGLKLFDIFLCVFLLFLVSMVFHSEHIEQSGGLWQKMFQLLKANTLASFSKFFLLPIMLWRENTTEFGVSLHRTLVTAHHICSLIFVYKIVSKFRTLRSTLVVIPIYIIKEFIMQYLLQTIEHNYEGIL